MSLYKTRVNGEYRWDPQESTRLNYQMIFEDRDSDSERKINEKYKKEIQEILSEREAEWRVKHQKESENSYQKGLADGREQGKKEAMEALDHRFSFLEKMISETHREFSERRERLTPGLLDTLFFLSEKILELPVENPEIRKRMERELEELVHKADETARPTLLVSESDYEFVQELIEKKASERVFRILTSSDCNPGEFILETDKGKVVQQFRQILNDFRNKLNIPSWQ